MLRSGVWSLIHRVTPFSFHADGYKHLGKECGVFGVIGYPDDALCYLTVALLHA